MLPAGYVINKKDDKGQRSDSDEDEKLTLEEEIEEQRAALDFSKGTPVTLDSFNAWKERKKREREEALEKKI